MGCCWNSLTGLSAILSMKMMTIFIIFPVFIPTLPSSSIFSLSPSLPLSLISSSRHLYYHHQYHHHIHHYHHHHYHQHHHYHENTNLRLNGIKVSLWQLRLSRFVLVVLRKPVPWWHQHLDLGQREQLLGEVYLQPHHHWRTWRQQGAAVPGGTGRPLVLPGGSNHQTQLVHLKGPGPRGGSHSSSNQGFTD